MRKLLLLLPLFAIIGCSENPTGFNSEPVETEPVEIVGAELREGVPVTHIIMNHEADKRLQKTAASGRVSIHFILKNEYSGWVNVGGLFVSVQGANGVYNSGNLDANGKFTTSADMVFPATMKLWFDDGKNGALGHYLLDTSGAIPCFVYNNINNAGEILEPMHPGRKELYRAWTEAMYTVYHINTTYTSAAGDLLNATPNKNGGKVAIDVRPSLVRRFEYRTDLNKIFIHYLSTRDLYTKMMEICSKLSHEYGGHYYQTMYISKPEIASDRCNAVDESYADFTQLYFGSPRYPGKNMFFDESQGNGVWGHTTFMTDMWDNYDNSLDLPGVPPDWPYRYIRPYDVITGFSFKQIVAFMRKRSPALARNLGQFRDYMIYLCDPNNQPKTLPAGVTRAMVVNYFKQMPAEYFTQP